MRVSKNQIKKRIHPNNAIACEIEGFDLDVCEIDKEYFENGVKAFNLHKQQMKLF